MAETIPTSTIAHQERRSGLILTITEPLRRTNKLTNRSDKRDPKSTKYTFGKNTSPPKTGSFLHISRILSVVCTTG
jgi:hypothetical protein